MGSSPKYVQVARATSEAQTRESLLDAAEQSLFAGTWNGTSLTALAELAGVTKQTLLRHFGNRDGLLRATVERASMRVADQRFKAPKDDIAGAVSNLLDHYDEVGELSQRISTIDPAEFGIDVAKDSRQLHYDWIDHAFGEALSRFTGVRRERTRRALIAVCDLQTWLILSRDLALDRGEVQLTLEHAIHQLLEERR